MHGARACSGQLLLPGRRAALARGVPAADTLLPAAAGMSAGVPKYVTVNLQQLNSKYQDGETVDLSTLQEKRLLNLSGREAKLPLKV